MTKSDIVILQGTSIRAVKAAAIAAAAEGWTALCDEPRRMRGGLGAELTRRGSAGKVSYEIVMVKGETREV